MQGELDRRGKSQNEKRNNMERRFFGAGNIILLLALVSLAWGFSGCSRPGIRAGAAECNITVPVGYEIQHYFRQSIGVHDSLYARCLYLEDPEGSSVAVICLDLLYGDFQACDELRKEIRERTGIGDALINFSHTHASVALGARGKTKIFNDTNSIWNDRTIDAILGIAQQAKEQAVPVSLRTGRADVQVGFNRRLLDEETGHIYMGDNREGPVVPWVNVLVANHKKTGKTMAVLFEHAAHPVIVPHTSRLISADYPGAAVKRVREVLGEDMVAMFGQGCLGNINGYPLRSTHEKADEAGVKLGNAVIQAIENSDPIHSNTFSIQTTRFMLPSAPLPSEEEWATMLAEHKKADLEEMNQYDYMGEWPGGASTSSMRMKQLNRIREMLDRGEEPPPRRFDACALMFGNEWCLTALNYELFCQYELWIDQEAPFRRTMTFNVTNGGQGYIALDEALRMGPKGGYEAATLPNWWGQVFGQHMGPPAVGCEKIIKDELVSLWTLGTGAGQPPESAP